MKKKILASLLAVAMMASLVVPAFADTYQSSSQSGTDDQISALAFDESSITVPNGKAEGVNLMSHLTAYAGNDKIVQDPTTLEWSIQDNLALGLNDNGVVYAVEDSGNAVVTVRVPGSKDISASIKVVATKQIVKKEAQGYKFEKASYTATTTSNAGAVDGNNAAWGNVEFKLIPLSDQYEFTQPDVDAIKLAFDNSAAINAYGTVTAPQMKIGNKDLVAGTFAVADKVDANGKIVITFTPTEGADRTMMQSISVNKTGTITLPEMKLPKTGDKDHPYKVPERSVRVDIKRPIQGQKIIRIASVKIEVGQTADLSKCYSITTGANYDYGVNYMLDFYNDAATVADFVVQSNENPNMIRGIAVGKQKAIINLNSTGASTVIPIEVVARGTLKTEEPSKMSLSATTGALKVGETMTITAKGVADGKEVTWAPSNGNITVTMKTTGEGAATITGKTAGTTLLFARVDGAIIGTAQITVAGADGTVPSTPPVTPNPHTGDSFFANLF